MAVNVIQSEDCGFKKIFVLVIRVVYVDSDFAYCACAVTKEKLYRHLLGIHEILFKEFRK